MPLWSDTGVSKVLEDTMVHETLSYCSDKQKVMDSTLINTIAVNINCKQCEIMTKSIIENQMNG